MAREQLFDCEVVELCGLFLFVSPRHGLVQTTLLRFCSVISWTSDGHHDAPAIGA